MARRPGVANIRRGMVTSVFAAHPPPPLLVYNIDQTVQRLRPARRGGWTTGKPIHNPCEIAIDASSPAGNYQTTTSATIATSAFTPPDRTLVTVAVTGRAPSTTPAITITLADSSGATWVQVATVSSATSGFIVTYIYEAYFPISPGSIVVTATFSSAVTRAFIQPVVWRHASQSQSAGTGSAISNGSSTTSGRISVPLTTASSAVFGISTGVIAPYTDTPLANTAELFDQPGTSSLLAVASWTSTAGTTTGPGPVTYGVTYSSARAGLVAAFEILPACGQALPIHLQPPRPRTVRRARSRVWTPVQVAATPPPVAPLLVAGISSRARWLPKRARSTLTAPPHPASVAPTAGHLVPSWRTPRPRLMPAGRGRVVSHLVTQVIPPPGPGTGVPTVLVTHRPGALRVVPRLRQFGPVPTYEISSIQPQQHNVQRLRPMPRGQIRGLPPNAKNITTLPVRQFVERDQPGQLRPRRGLVVNHIFPGFIQPPPTAGPLRDRYVKQPRLRLPSPRGHIFTPTHAPTWPQPWFVPSRRPALTKQRSGIVRNWMSSYTPPNAGPLNTKFIRQSGTRNRVLRISHATLPGVLNAFYQPPPRPVPPRPSPAGGSVSVSTGRRKWPQPVLFDYPKSLVWK